jgi:hypothetical protein
MKNNLVFTGLTYRSNENCEQKLRHFICEELAIEQFIEFGNVHRLGKIGNRGARPIVARFLYPNQKQMILENGYKLKNGRFGVHEQFLGEMVGRRRKLYPVMNEYKHQGKRVSLVRDHLYIEGELYNLIDDNNDGNTLNTYPGNLSGPNFTPQTYNRNIHRSGRPLKRPRAGSSQHKDDETVI